MRRRHRRVILQVTVLRFCAVCWEWPVPPATRTGRHGRPGRFGSGPGRCWWARSAWLHAGSRGACGAPRIHAAPRRVERVVNSKRTERLMRRHRIAGITRRRRGLYPAGEARGVRARPDRPGLHRTPARDAARRRHD
ncbi:IS3 family transposase [Streptomyces murinus]|uniref:IS3 family transposase n=1 Tax=Streptomyces murinus TaxID=33900 RepID=UPI00380C89EF